MLDMILNYWWVSGPVVFLMGYVTRAFLDTSLAGVCHLHYEKEIENLEDKLELADAKFASLDLPASERWMMLIKENPHLDAMEKGDLRRMLEVEEERKKKEGSPSEKYHMELGESRYSKRDGEMGTFEGTWVEVIDVPIHGLSPDWYRLRWSAEIGPNTVVRLTDNEGKKIDIARYNGKVDDGCYQTVGGICGVTVEDIDCFRKTSRIMLVFHSEHPTKRASIRDAEIIIEPRKKIGEGFYGQ